VEWPFTFLIKKVKLRTAGTGGLVEPHKIILSCLARGEFRLSLHALDRADERIVTEGDIVQVGKTARRCVFQPDRGTWRVDGKDLDGERLTVICTLEDGVLVVTVF
jgi:hypothetical protein